MAFAGAFVSQIREVNDGKSNLTTSAEQFAKLFINDDISRSSSSSSTDSDSTSSNESFDSRPTNNTNRNEYTETNYRGVLDSDLTSLTTAQRNIFIVILTVLFVLSLCGNVCTVFVNFRRKIRPFFRACLISLALSDLMNTVFLTASYLSQFTADFVQIWSLGNVMCSLVPFATTCAILASSMTLVGIALDRYFAVMKAVIGFWDPSVISCLAYILCIWLASISIACPVFTFYNIIPVYILTEEHDTVNGTVITTAAIAKTALNATQTDGVPMLSKKPHIAFTANLIKSSETTMRSVMAAMVATETKMSWESDASLENMTHLLVHKKYLVNMCISNQENVSVYYIIVFTIIFVPCIVAFFWFNTVIARKLWKQRHFTGITKQNSCQIKTKTKPMTTAPPSNTEATQTERSKTVLISNKTCTCKPSQMSSSTALPSTMSNTFCGKVKPTAACFNINNSREARHLRMFTIILFMMAVFVFLRLPAWIFLLMRMYGKYTTTRCWILYFIFGLMNLASSVLNPVFYTFLTETLKYVLMLKAKVASLHCVRCLQACCCAKNNSLVGCCSSALCRRQTSMIDDRKYCVQTHALQSKVSTKACRAHTDSKKEEDVDCNDEVHEQNICSIHGYNQNIYTIFPSSLVSSSINSDNSSGLF